MVCIMFSVTMYVSKGVYLCIVTELSALVKLKFLDLSGNGFSGSMELQGKSVHIFNFSIKSCEFTFDFVN